MRFLVALLLLPAAAAAQTHTSGMLDLTQIWTGTNTYTAPITVTASATVSGATQTGTLKVNTSTLPTNAMAVSSGTLVVQSTTSTSAQPVIQGLNFAGTELLRVQQDGKVGVSSATPTDTLSVQGTINTNGYKAGGVSGSSLGSTCSGGQALGGTLSVINGIVTGSPSCITNGGGDVLTTATQTLSGINTFTSTASIVGLLAVGITSYTASGVLNYSNGLNANDWTIVGGTYVVNATTISFTNVLSSVSYMVQCEMYYHGAAPGNCAFPSLWFNNIFAASGPLLYSYQFQHIGSPGNQTLDNNTAAAIILTSSCTTTASTSTFTSNIFFKTYLSSSTGAEVQFTSGIQAIPIHATSVGGGSYHGNGTPITSFQLGANNSMLTTKFDARITVWGRLGFITSP